MVGETANDTHPHNDPAHTHARVFFSFSGGGWQQS